MQPFIAIKQFFGGWHSIC